MVKPPLHTSKPSPRRWFNRLYIFVYTIAIFALLYRHSCNLISTPSFTTTLLLVADIVLAFVWATWQAYFINPVQRQVFPENLPHVAKESEYPGLDVFVCTADPFKEPPVGVVNTVLSVLAYDYPTDKLSVYVSDDGGSQLTLFAFIEAAKFAKHWLPYCRKYDIVDRSPEVYFGNNPSLGSETNEIQVMYENLKSNIQDVVDRGTVDLEKINDAFRKWNPEFTRHQHPTVIEVLLKCNQDKDVTGHNMPNLVYLAREKNKSTPHHFKAGALNALIRVSTVITNAPILLILDCDMYSNDPRTPLRMLCYFMDPKMDRKLAFVQFPQRFHNINKNDTYGVEHVIETRLCPEGMDGLGGSIFMGTGGFFRRQALIEYPKMPTHLWTEPSKSQDVLGLAHHVASCSYEDDTEWGSEIGFRYGTLVEDIYTGFRLQCLGWKSVTCNPIRPAFLGNMPITVNDFLTQAKRWNLGLLQTALSKFSPLTFGIKFLNPLHALCYAYYHFRAILCIPLMVYAYLPQIALFNAFPIFPKVSNPWFSLYAFLFLGAYGKEFVDILVAGCGFRKWWSRQRMWLILGNSSFPFSIFDWFLSSIGMSTFDFNVTNKVSNNELTKRYEKGVFELGVESPLLLSVNIAAMVNLFAFSIGVKHVWIHTEMFEELFVQLFITGFAVVNSWPIYEGMVLRSDKGKVPMKTTLKSVSAALVFYFVFSSAF